MSSPIYPRGPISSRDLCPSRKKAKWEPRFKKSFENLAQIRPLRTGFVHQCIFRAFSCNKIRVASSKNCENLRNKYCEYSVFWYQLGKSYFNENHASVDLFPKTKSNIMTCDYIPPTQQLNECDWNCFGVYSYSQRIGCFVSLATTVYWAEPFFFQTNRLHETSSQQGPFIDFIAFFSLLSRCNPRTTHFISSPLLSCL